MNGCESNGFPLSVTPTDTIHVNSAHGVGIVALDDLLPTAENDGSISVAEFLRLSGYFDGSTIPRDEPWVIGRVMIRVAIEELGRECRGKPYTDRRARSIMAKEDFFLYAGDGDDGGIPFTLNSSLAGSVDEHYKQACRSHRESLKIAREAQTVVSVSFAGQDDPL